MYMYILNDTVTKEAILCILQLALNSKQSNIVAHEELPNEQVCYQMHSLRNLFNRNCCYYIIIIEEHENPVKHEQRNAGKDR